jgi:hypothetical protein
MVRVQGSIDEQSSILGIWREAAAIIRGHPVATIVPAVVLGALAEAPYYFIDDSRPVLEKVLASVGAALAYYLYVAYAEKVATEAERGANSITAFGVLGRLHQATPVALPVVVASVPAVVVPTAATGLLILPGLWLLTRWSLFAPVISREGLGPLAALERSTKLVRGNFQLVFWTATLAFILEAVTVHAGALVGYLVTGSETWGEWLGGTIANSFIMSLAALTTSVAYVRLEMRTKSKTKPSRPTSR